MHERLISKNLLYIAPGFNNMSKSYYSFEKHCSFGDLSGRAGCMFTSDDKHLISSSSTCLSIWNIRRSELTKKISFSSQITQIAYKKIIALGFQNGHISVHSYEDEILNKFEGHDSTISALVFSQDSLTLYSGSYDTTIIIWDLVGDCALKRLQGHRDAITALYLTKSLYSCSRDKMIKQWNLDMCVNTFVCPGEVWGVCKHDKKIYAVCGKFIRIWENNSEVGFIERSDVKRCKKFIVNNDLLVVCSASKMEIWRVMGDEEKRKKVKRRRKRNKDQSIELSFADQYQKVLLHKFSEKINSVSLSNTLHRSRSYENKILISISYASNSLEIYTFQYNSLKKLKTPPEFTFFSSVSYEGHRSSARTLSLSEDNNSLLTGSGESVKIWDMSSNKCISHLESGYCLCSCWFPGDKYIMVGCRSGELQIFDILTNEKLINKQAHEGSIWGCSLKNQILLTGGSDSYLKWWTLKLKPFKLKLLEQTPVKDEILAVKWSPCSKYICLALLDSTIQVLYSDSKKLLFSVY